MFKKLLLASFVGMCMFPLAPVHADFSDVPSTQFNADAISYLTTNQVVQGYSDSTYKPLNRINRAEFIKILVGATTDAETIQGCTKSSFKDVNPKEWFAPYVCVAKKNGWVSGYPDGTFRPASFINFAESGKVVTNALAIKASTTPGPEWFAEPVEAMAEKKAIPSTVQFFDKDITRGEMAEMVWRLKADITDKVSSTYEEITQPLPHIQSCDALKEKFDEYQSRVTNMYLMKDAEVMPMAPSLTEATTSAAADDFSQTNLQVAGVDEADSIKNDGEFIYMIKNQSVRVIKAYPADALKEIATIDYADTNFNPRELYIREKQLVVMGSSSEYYPGPVPLQSSAVMRMPYYYGGGKTRVYLYDLSDPSLPKETRKLSFDGSYQTSRRIENSLYLVLTQSPHYWSLDKIKQGEDLVPSMQEGDKEPEKMTGCTDIRFFPGHIQPSYLIVAGIPLDKPEGEVSREVLLGSGENVFSSRTNLYVAATEYNANYYGDWDWHRDSTKTQVYKFALENGVVTFKARGNVAGRPLNQFSMDAYIDHFRIATTIDSWDPEHPSENNVYVLDADMNTVGSIEGIAPGERIYSTRFMGNRLYMVTFRQIDPFFVIDLKNPTSPSILGKLKIPGVSDYLEPYDENHIIGFGLNTAESKDVNFVWYQGMKLSLYDVTDVKNPKEVFVENIGDRGTSSEILSSHKALLFDKTKNLIAFPITINEIPSDKKTATPDSGAYGEPVFQGAIIYHLNLISGFQLQGKITHYTPEDLLKVGYGFYNYAKNIQRIIFIGKNFYTISPDVVKASAIDDLKELGSISVGGDPSLP